MQACSVYCSIYCALREALYFLENFRTGKKNAKETIEGRAQY